VADGTLLAIAQWRESAERLAEEVARGWELQLGEPYVPGFCGHVVRATTADGTPAVLKVFFPDHESLQEADALERWGGDGAIRLLDRDDERCALLLERCEPGEFLSSAGGERALDVLIEMLPRLWKSADGFHTLADEVERWIERGLDAGTAGLARELASSQGAQVLVHQDLHGDNVVSASREAWLVIDPKPLAAEREFSVAPIVRSGELGHSKRDVLYRLDRLCDELALDRERARGWTIVQTLAWSEGNRIDSHLEVVEWLR
jgi:streptomycin 6-kinase